MSEFDFDDVIRTAKVIVNPEQAASSILALTNEAGRLAAELDTKQALLDEAIRKGLQLCEQNGTLLMEAHDLRVDLFSAVQMVALALSANEHGWKREHVASLQKFLYEHLEILEQKP
jgi:hypothetical protein